VALLACGQRGCSTSRRRRWRQRTARTTTSEAQPRRLRARVAPIATRSRSATCTPICPGSARHPTGNASRHATSLGAHRSVGPQPRGRHAQPRLACPSVCAARWWPRR
jgi:hypothetical protein